MMPARPKMRHPVDVIGIAADRVRQEITLAHFIGKIAVERGVRAARDQLDDVLSTLASASDSSDPPAAEVANAEVQREAMPPAGSAPRPPVEELALADYDQLPSAHIVAKLAGLEQSERDDIEAYESLGRHRRTILGKLALLREAGDT